MDMRMPEICGQFCTMYKFKASTSVNICTQISKQVSYDFIIIRVNISVRMKPRIFVLLTLCSTPRVNESTFLFPVMIRKFSSFVHHRTVYTDFNVCLICSKPSTGISPFSSRLQFLFFRSNYSDIITDAHQSHFETSQSSVVHPLVNAEPARGRLSCLRAIS